MTNYYFHSEGNSAIATKSEKNQNQDYCDMYKGTYLSAIAIADGLSSSIDSHKASKLAVTNFLKDLKSFDLQEKEKEIELEDVKKIWENTEIKIKNYCEDNYQDRSKVLQTTLITIIELDDKYLISYLGNGSILYIRGDFWKFWDKRWPWCISDLMIGHSVFMDGIAKLYGLLGPEEDTSKVRYLSVIKDTYCGEIFILTTDGISSPDHAGIFRDDKTNGLLLGINRYVESLVNVHIGEFLRCIAYCGDLEDTIKRFFEFKFDDDASLGVMISNKAIDYYKSDREKCENFNK